MKWELELKYDIEEVLAHEELLWFQKLKVERLKYDDRNTTYFHSRTLNRCKRKKIEGLVVDFEWCFEEERLKHHVREFFNVFIPESTRLMVHLLVITLFLSSQMMKLVALVLVLQMRKSVKPCLVWPY